MTPRPGPVLATGPVFLPGCLTDTDFHLTSMGWMHRDHARERFAARVRSTPEIAGTARHAAPFLDSGNPLAGVSTTVGLTPDDLFGQLNQHLFGSQIRQILKSPHQSQ